MKHEAKQNSKKVFTVTPQKEVADCCKVNTASFGAIEYTGVIYLIVGFLALALIYFTTGPTLFNLSSESYFAKYGIWTLYLAISISTIGIALWHLFSYKTKVTCMVGMMLGMTIGMQTGMMVGAIVGATNGFFLGSMVGMLLGVTVGILAGKCCGVMGVMEGMMAGLMGGTMGPMITVMMLADNVHIFMPFYMIINVIILFSMSYMFLKEHVSSEKEISCVPQKVSGLLFFSLLIIVGLVIYLLMVYGPKSFIVQ